MGLDEAGSGDSAGTLIVLGGVVAYFTYVAGATWLVHRKLRSLRMPSDYRRAYLVNRAIIFGGLVLAVALGWSGY